MPAQSAAQRLSDPPVQCAIADAGDAGDDAGPADARSGCMSPTDMGTTQLFRYDSTQSQKVLILAQLMTDNGFQELIQINS